MQSRLLTLQMLLVFSIAWITKNKIR